MYLESMAIVPQLFMFQKQAKGIVEVLVSIRPYDAVLVILVLLSVLPFLPCGS